MSVRPGLIGAIAALSILPACAVTPPPAPAADAAIDSIEALFRTCRYAEAEAKALPLLQSANPVDRAMAQVHLGDVKWARDDVAGAVTHYRAALVDDVFTADQRRVVLQSLGKALVVLERFGEALEVFKEDLVIQKLASQAGHPISVDSQELLHIAVAYGETGEWEQVRQVVAAARRLEQARDSSWETVEKMSEAARTAPPAAGALWRVVFGDGDAPAAKIAFIPPVPIRRYPPVYPREAARKGIEGDVDLDVVIDAQGNVTSAKVAQSKPAAVFDAAAEESVARWRFMPPMVDCKPQAQRFRQRLSFRMAIR